MLFVPLPVSSWDQIDATHTYAVSRGTQQTTPSSAVGRTQAIMNWSAAQIIFPLMHTPRDRWNPNWFQPEAFFLLPTVSSLPTSSAFSLTSATLCKDVLILRPDMTFLHFHSPVLCLPCFSSLLLLLHPLPFLYRKWNPGAGIKTVELFPINLACALRFFLSWIYKCVCGWVCVSPHIYCSDFIDKVLHNRQTVQPNLFT